MTSATPTPQWGQPGMRAADHPLNMALMMAVPIQMFALAEQGGPTAEDFAQLQELDAILERADELLLFKGKGAKPGELAEAFNKLARGLAVMSYIPGGVTFGGEFYQGKDVMTLVQNFVQERTPPEETEADDQDTGEEGADSDELG